MKFRIGEAVMLFRFRLSAALLLAAVMISAALAQAPGTRPARPGARPGAAGGKDLRMPDLLKEGDMAPDFTLPSPDGKRKVTLSEFRGKKPVALVFGSYT
jgi:hypothetical protein